MEKFTKNQDIRKVVIADDHAIVRQGTIDILKRISHVEVVAEAENGLMIYCLKAAHPKKYKRVFCLFSMVQILLQRPLGPNLKMQLHPPN